MWESITREIKDVDAAEQYFSIVNKQIMEYLKKREVKCETAPAGHEHKEGETHHNHHNRNEHHNFETSQSKILGSHRKKMLQV